MIETIALVMFIISFIGVFFSFWPELRPKNSELGDAWDVFTNVPMMTGVFVAGMILLYAFT